MLLRQYFFYSDKTAGRIKKGPAEQEERKQIMRTWETLREQHPCMSGRAGETGRIHLPVSPGCTIHCRYGKREFTRSEERPGTCLRVLPVKDVPEIVEKALALCPQITTVGIAGPGESLASPHALEAFRILNRIHPELIKCLSTNGLMLPDMAERRRKCRVKARCKLSRRNSLPN